MIPCERNGVGAPVYCFLLTSSYSLRTGGFRCTSVLQPQHRRDSAVRSCRSHLSLQYQNIHRLCPAHQHEECLISSHNIGLNVLSDAKTYTFINDKMCAKVEEILLTIRKEKKSINKKQISLDKAETSNTTKYHYY